MYTHAYMFRCFEINFRSRKPHLGLPGSRSPAQGPWVVPLRGGAPNMAPIWPYWPYIPQQNSLKGAPKRRIFAGPACQVKGLRHVRRPLTCQRAQYTYVYSYIHMYVHVDVCIYPCLCVCCTDVYRFECVQLFILMLLLLTHFYL